MRNFITLSAISISRRLPFLVALAVVSAGIATAIASGLFGRAALENALQDNLETLAFSQAQQIEHNLKQHISRILSLSEQQNIRLELQLPLNEYALLTDEEIAATLQQQNNAWLEALALENPRNTVIVRNIFLNRISAYTFASQKESLATNLGLENNFLLVDKQGGIVAASYLPADYTQTNQQWWIELQETDDIYLDGPLLVKGPLLAKADTPEKLMAMAVPVYSTNNDEVVGGLYNTFDYSLVTDVINQVRQSNAGRTILVDSAGHVIYAPETLPAFQNKTLPLEQTINTLYAFDTSAGTFNITAVPLNSATPVIENLGWFVVGVQSRSQALSPVTNAILPAIIIALLICLLSVSLLYTLYVRPLTVDLSELHKGALALSQGNLDTQVDVKRKDELGVLTNTFNQMTNRLKNSYAHLEQQVANRTAELEQQTKELAKAKETALAAQHTAEAANQAKSAFLSNMSHELRSPLNAILGFAQVLQRSQTLASKHREHINIIQRSGDHLLTLINQVLDLSKIEAGRITLNPKSFDLHRLLHDLEDMFALQADRKQLHLRFERSPDVPRHIRTDEIKLRQVLINLLNNALKFTEKGGVTLWVGSREYEAGSKEENTPLLPASYSKQPAVALHFEVTDTGPGIAPEDLDTVFEAFSQTETGRRAQEGTGLGLPISRRFVQLMGGDIQVESPPSIPPNGGKVKGGQGTTFKFNIQVEVVDVVGSQNQKPVPSAAEGPKIQNQVIALKPNQPRYRILVVDDQPANRQLLIELLNPLGFELKEAENGQQALEIWETWQPHLIWMDMRMPVMDGYEATKIIKSKQSKTSGLSSSHRPSSEVKDPKPALNVVEMPKIIAVTASSFEEERAVVLKAGCDDYLRKPFRADDIFALLEQHLGARFIYAKPQPAHQASHLSAADLASLPPARLIELTEIVETLDLEMIEAQLDEIGQSQPDLAPGLKQLVRNYQFDDLLALLEEAKAYHEQA